MVNKPLLNSLIYSQTTAAFPSPSMKNTQLITHNPGAAAPYTSSFPSQPRPQGTCEEALCLFTVILKVSCRCLQPPSSLLLPLTSLALCNFEGPSGPLPEGSAPLNSPCSQGPCLASSSPSQHNGARSPFSRQAHRSEKCTPHAAGWPHCPLRCCQGALGFRFSPFWLD